MSLLNRINKHNIDLFSQLRQNVPILPLNGNVYSFFPALNNGYFEVYIAPWYSGSKKSFVEEIKRTQLDRYWTLPGVSWVISSETLVKKYSDSVHTTHGQKWLLVDCSITRPVFADDLLYSKKNVEEIIRLEFVDNENFVCSTVV